MSIHLVRSVRGSLKAPQADRRGLGTASWAGWVCAPHQLPRQWWKLEISFLLPWPGTDTAQDCHEGQLVNKMPMSPGRQKCAYMDNPGMCCLWRLECWHRCGGFSLASCFSESQTKVSSGVHTAQEPAWITDTAEEIKMDGRGGSGCSLPRSSTLSWQRQGIRVKTLPGGFRRLSGRWTRWQRSRPSPQSAQALCFEKPRIMFPLPRSMGTW